MGSCDVRSDGEGRFSQRHGLGFGFIDARGRFNSGVSSGGGGGSWSSGAVGILEKYQRTAEDKKIKNCVRLNNLLFCAFREEEDLESVVSEACEKVIR